MKRHTKIIFSVISILLVLIYVSQFRQINSLLVPLLNMNKVSTVIYTEKHLDTKVISKFQENIKYAKERVRNFIGGPLKANPTFILAINESTRNRFSQNSYGIIYVSPIGTVIIIGSKGVDSIDILAHEILHAEHYANVGFFKWFKTPHWFIEGVGMQVDEREVYNFNNFPKNLDQESLPKLSEISSLRGFFNNTGRLNYIYSKEEVRHWLNTNNVNLRSFLQSQFFFRPFMSQYCFKSKNKKYNLSNQVECINNGLIHKSLDL